CAPEWFFEGHRFGVCGHRVQHECGDGPCFSGVFFDEVLEGLFEVAHASPRITNSISWHIAVRSDSQAVIISSARISRYETIHACMAMSLRLASMKSRIASVALTAPPGLWMYSPMAAPVDDV